MNPICYLLCFYSLFLTWLINGQGYHVSVDGDDDNPGNKQQPFRTISQAASIALPDDVITVHEGT